MNLLRIKYLFCPNSWIIFRTTAYIISFFFKITVSKALNFTNIFENIQTIVLNTTKLRLIAFRSVGLLPSNHIGNWIAARLRFLTLKLVIPKWMHTLKSWVVYQLWLNIYPNKEWSSKSFISSINVVLNQIPRQFHGSCAPQEHYVFFWFSIQCWISDHIISCCS